MSPVKVTLTPSKEGEGEAKPTEEILTLETEEEEEEEKAEEKVCHPQLWEKCLVLSEQPEEYDSEEDPEYIPPAVILDTSFEYDEVSSYARLYARKLNLPLFSLLRRRRSSPTTRLNS